MTDQQNPMPPGWYPDPMQPGHQREWSGYEWVGPSVRIGAKGGFPKWLIPVIACLALGFVAVVGGAIAGGDPEDEADEVRVERSTTTDEPTTTERTTTTDRETTTEAPTTEVPTTEAPPTTTAPTTTTTTAPPPPTTAGPTISQSNARQKAAQYLEFQSFSRSGLIDQLKFEGFSEEDATYGVDAVNPDWNEQAAKKAAQYLEFQSFSHSGLVDQLVFEGFTPEQAEYGVSTTGL
jgi:hypothetical protein